MSEKHDFVNITCILNLVESNMYEHQVDNVNLWWVLEGISLIKLELHFLAFLFLHCSKLLWAIRYFTRLERQKLGKQFLF